MKSLLYIRIDGQTHGPFTAPDIKRLTGAGRILPDHLVGRSEEGPWHRVCEVAGLMAPGAAGAVRQHARSGSVQAQPQPQTQVQHLEHLAEWPLASTPESAPDSAVRHELEGPVVFISHSSVDRGMAEAVCAVLQTRGITSWIAHRDIPPGADWGASIIEALSRSRLVVLLLTADANRSPHVTKEMERSVDKRIPILPVRAEEVTLSPSLEYFLSSAQWFHAALPPFEQHLELLAQRVCDLLVHGEGHMSLHAPSAKRPQLARWRTPAFTALIGITAAAALAAAVMMPFLIPRIPSHGSSSTTSPSARPRTSAGRTSHPATPGNLSDDTVAP